MSSVPPLFPCLWFSTDAEDALRHYLAVFADSRVLEEKRWGPGGMGPPGSLLYATVELRGQRVLLLSGRRERGFTDACSLVVHCETQEEIDHHWNSLVEGGRPSQCGWLQDRFGVSWQIVPRVLGELLSDPACAGAVMQVMLPMQKLDLGALLAAAGRKSPA